MRLNDLLFGFKGRMRRRDWWLWGIAFALAWTAATTAVGAALFGVEWARGLFGGPGVPGGWSITAYGLVTYVPLLWVQSALAARRAHDRNRGAAVVVGLTLLAGLLSFVPEISDLTIGVAATDRLIGPVTGVVIVIQLYLLVVLGILDGTRGPNRFGRSPAAIAHERRVSLGTVRTQVRRIYEKIGVTSQLELAARLPKL